MYKLVFFVPTEAKESVKQAVFDAGGGKIGHYDRCCFETEGRGQFRPLAGAQPHIGQTGTLEMVAETRVELVVEDADIRPVVAAMKSAHPYETPAFDLWKLEALELT